MSVVVSNIEHLLFTEYMRIQRLAKIQSRILEKHRKIDLTKTKKPLRSSGDLVDRAVTSRITTEKSNGYEHCITVSAT